MFTARYELMLKYHCHICPSKCHTCLYANVNDVVPTLSICVFETICCQDYFTLPLWRSSVIHLLAMFYQNRPTSDFAAWPAVTKQGQQSCAKTARNGMGKRESWRVRCTSALLPCEMHPTARYKTTPDVYRLHTTHYTLHTTHYSLHTTHTVQYHKTTNCVLCSAKQYFLWHTTKSSYTISNGFPTKAVLMPSSFRAKAIIVTKVTDYPTQTK